MLTVESMRNFPVLIAFALTCGASGCSDPTSSADFDVRTGSIRYARSVLQRLEGSEVSDWLRVSFEFDDYEDNQPILKQRIPLAVDSVTLNGQSLRLLDSISLIYGFESFGGDIHLSAGRQVIDVHGGASLASYREDVVIPRDARITSPSPGDTVSINNGFWLEWDNIGSRSESAETGVGTVTNPMFEILTATDDDGRAYVKDFGAGFMTPGPAEVILVRRTESQRSISEAVTSTVTMTSVVRVPIMLAP